MTEPLDVNNEFIPLANEPGPEKEEEVQIALQPLQNALEELNRKLLALRKQFAKNPDKYRPFYKAAKALRDNLQQNLAMYNRNAIGALTFTGLNHLHINQAQPLLENKVRGWGRNFFNSLKNAVNRFFSFIRVTTRSFENELVDFKEKIEKLKTILQKPNQENLATYLVKLNPIMQK